MLQCLTSKFQRWQRTKKFFFISIFLIVVTIIVYLFLTPINRKYDGFVITQSGHKPVQIELAMGNIRSSFFLEVPGKIRVSQEGKTLIEYDVELKAKPCLKTDFLISRCVSNYATFFDGGVGTLYFDMYANNIVIDTPANVIYSADQDFLFLFRLETGMDTSMFCPRSEK